MTDTPVSASRTSPESGVAMRASAPEKPGLRAFLRWCVRRESKSGDASPKVRLATTDTMSSQVDTMAVLGRACVVSGRGGVVDATAGLPERVATPQPGEAGRAGAVRAPSANEHGRRVEAEFLLQKAVLARVSSMVEAYHAVVLDLAGPSEVDPQAIEVARALASIDPALSEIAMAVDMDLAEEGAADLAYNVGSSAGDSVELGGVSDGAVGGSRFRPLISWVLRSGRAGVGAGR